MGDGVDEPSWEAECWLRPRRLRLPTDTTAPRRARAFLEEAHCDDHSAEVLDDAKLLVSELVTNAYRHGVAPIELGVACVGRRELEVRVRDAGTEGAFRHRTASAEDESGRGLSLVDLLSRSWGTYSGPDGKEVWFRLVSP